MNDQGIAYRFLHFFLTKIVIGIVVVVGLYVSCQVLLNTILPATGMSVDARNFITSIACASVAILAYSLLYRFYESRKVNELSVKKLGQHLAIGILVGALLQSLTILVMYLSGSYTVMSYQSFMFLLPAFLMAFSSAIFEEILLRGIIFRLLEEKLGSYIALLISALIFGALHLGNPNSNLLVSLGLAIQAGLLLGVAFMYSRNLWFPIAIHFAWNFVQSGIFGAAVSGNAARKSLITPEISGNILITGGSFGPEGSLQATVFCLIATIILLILCVRKKKILRMSRQI